MQGSCFKYFVDMNVHKESIVPIFKTKHAFSSVDPSRRIHAAFFSSVQGSEAGHQTVTLGSVEQSRSILL